MINGRELKFFTCGLLLLITNLAHAVPVLSIDMDPSTAGIQSVATVSSGLTTTVDIIVDGLVNGGSPSLGAYDVDLDFDTAVLTPSILSFGTNMGSSITGVAGSGPVNVFEVSLESASTLNTLQPDTFVLFSMTFDVISVGSSSLDLINIVLSDELGNGFNDVIVNGGEINPRSIPEPTTLALMGLGLAGLGYRRKKIKLA